MPKLQKILLPIRVSTTERTRPFREFILLRLNRKKIYIRENK